MAKTSIDELVEYFEAQAFYAKEIAKQLERGEKVTSHTECDLPLAQAWRMIENRNLAEPAAVGEDQPYLSYHPFIPKREGAKTA
ncbi:hypothetical protein [Gorillibacterium sp. CAU 1737]|uniref:hypothetical protein n=1 Tax=Gorillibacterium sp. CAU 1737 TaxID=3140362 RepID=UPI0032606C3B